MAKSLHDLGFADGAVERVDIEAKFHDEIYCGVGPGEAASCCPSSPSRRGAATSAASDLAEEGPRGRCASHLHASPLSGSGKSPKAAWIWEKGILSVVTTSG